jgi:hypothetical protein
MSASDPESVIFTTRRVEINTYNKAYRRAKNNIYGAFTAILE